MGGLQYWDPYKSISVIQAGPCRAVGRAPDL